MAEERGAEERGAYSIPQFCESHSISRGGYYTIPPEDRPRELRLGNRVLITREEAAAWRARMVEKTQQRLEEQKAEAEIVARAIMDALESSGGARSKVIAEQLRRDHPSVAWPDDLADQIERALRGSCSGDPAELMAELERRRV